MIDFNVVKKYIDDILASIYKLIEIKKFIDTIDRNENVKSKEKDNINFNRITDMLREEETKTLEVNIIENARLIIYEKLTESNKDISYIEERRLQCSQSLKYSVSQLGTTKLRVIIDRILNSHLLGWIGDKLIYSYKTIKSYERSYKLCGIIVCRFISNCIQKDSYIYFDKLNQYLRDDPIVQKPYTNFISNSDYKNRMALLEIIYMAVAFHDIGMCILSDILQKENISDRLFRKNQNGLPIQSGMGSLNKEKAILNDLTHQEIGSIYIRGISAGDSLYEDAIFHHSKSNAFSKLIDLAHSIAVEYHNNKKYINLIPSWNVYREFEKNKNNVELGFIETIELFAKILEKRIRNENNDENS